MNHYDPALNLPARTGLDRALVDYFVTLDDMRLDDIKVDVGSTTTWDGTVFSGQLEEQNLVCHLVSGVDVHVPLALLKTYDNPQTATPALMVDRIKTIVAVFNSDSSDWKIFVIMSQP